jgi:hypothetical protein
MADGNYLYSFSLNAVNYPVIFINLFTQVFIPLFWHDSSGFRKLGNRFDDSIHFFCK